MMLFSPQLLLPKSEERGSDDAHMDVLLFSKQRNSYKSVVLMTCTLIVKFQRFGLLYAHIFTRLVSFAHSFVPDVV
jgi:hypothetical protein